MSSAETEAAMRVYCAGPLFNQAERDEMTAIADVLGEAGYAVYLPHRDGMEFRLVLGELEERGWPQPTAGLFLHSAIFALDVYQLVVECGAMVWNLNGRTPDEGAVSEAAMAWTLGKPLVAYKEDVRSLITGRDNPLLVGMVDFETVREMGALPAALLDARTRCDAATVDVSALPTAMQRAVGQGSLLWTAMQDGIEQNQTNTGLNAMLADLVTELFAPRPQPA